MIQTCNCTCCKRNNDFSNILRGLTPQTNIEVKALESKLQQREELLREACEIIKYGGITTRNPSAYNLINKDLIKELMGKG